MTVRRDSEWVEREYGREVWPEVDALIAQEIERGGDLGRVFHRAIRAYMSPGTALEPRDAIVDGTRVRVPWPVTQGAFQELVTQVALDAWRPETDLVVELGAGWGRNLFALWLAAGHDVRYVAAEFTAAGRSAAARLAELDTALRLEAVAFDYHDPDLRALRGKEHALVITSHSIEQIPQVGPHVLDEILALGDAVTCVHFEPLGWQLDPSRAGSSVAYAQRHDYNRNLVPVLREAEAAGRIVIEAQAVSPVGANPENATSVVRWRSA